MEIIIQPP